MTEEECYHELYKIFMRDIEEAKREGAAREKAAIVVRMFNGGIPVDQIALCSNLTVEEVNDIVAQSPKAAPTDAVTA